MDLIIYNATIYTVNKTFALAESAAIQQGRFVAVGSHDEILGKFKAKTMIDMEGRFVYPGLIDPHCHFYGYGCSLAHADLVGARSFDEIKDILLKHDEGSPSEWILGRGWDQNLWPVQAFPHRRELDRIFPDKPVLLIRIDGHAAIANTEALRRAGVGTASTVEGGKFLKEDKELTGVLIDRAIEVVRQCVPPLSDAENVSALMHAQKNCFAVGLTSVGDAGLDKETIKLMDSLQQSGDLKMRIYAMLKPNQDNFDAFLCRGPYKTDRINVRSVKLYADGALGSRGASLIDEYSDDPGNYGLLVETPAYLEKISRMAWERGYQVNTHCIGDSAARLMLNIYGRILGGHNDRRWRTEHVQMVHPDDFDLFRAYSVIPSIQATHATSDMRWVIHRIGPERIKTAYAYRRLLGQVGWLPNGSDFPIEHINPLYGFYAAVARKNLEGYPDGGFQTENALAREEALKAMTLWAAKAAFEDDEKGSIEPGKFADFIVVDDDLMRMDIDRVPQLGIERTFSGGQEVFSRQR